MAAVIAGFCSLPCRLPICGLPLALLAALWLAGRIAILNLAVAAAAGRA